MTYRKIRQVLSEVQNDKMTVKELRDILLEVEEQDSEIEVMDILTLTWDK